MIARQKRNLVTELLDQSRHPGFHQLVVQYEVPDVFPSYSDFEQLKAAGVVMPWQTAVDLLSADKLGSPRHTVEEIRLFFTHFPLRSLEYMTKHSRDQLMVSPKDAQLLLKVLTWTADRQARLKVLRMLLEDGADVNSYPHAVPGSWHARVEGIGRRALERAVEDGDEDVVRLFIEFGARDAIWKEVGPAAKIATSRGYDEIAKMIAVHDAKLLQEEQELRAANKKYGWRKYKAGLGNLMPWV
jgi:hypothetical protein